MISFDTFLKATENWMGLVLVSIKYNIPGVSYKYDDPAVGITTIRLPWLSRVLYPQKIQALKVALNKHWRTYDYGNTISVKSNLLSRCSGYKQDIKL